VVTALPARAEVVVHDARVKADMKVMFMTHHRFPVHRVFDEDASNDAVYDATVAPMLARLAAGGSAACLMFGQTGSGKTHTMTGLQERLAADLFGEGSPLGARHRLSLSSVEVSGSSVTDLLARGSPAVRALKDADGRLTLHGAARAPVSGAADLRRLFAAVAAGRATCGTKVNHQSSRSHAACVLECVDAETGRRGDLLLVDLAGSERNEDSSHHGPEQARQSAAINASLAVLKECIRVLSLQRSGAPRAPARVPYRDSKLTALLEPTLSDPESDLCLVATVSPGSQDTEHSVNTLRHVQLLAADAGRAAAEERGVRNAVVEELEARARALPPHPSRWTRAEAAAWWEGQAARVAGRLGMRAVPPMGPPADGKALVRFSALRFGAHASGARGEEFGAAMLEALQQLAADAQGRDRARREAIKHANAGQGGRARDIMSAIAGGPGGGKAPARAPLRADATNTPRGSRPASAAGGARGAAARARPASAAGGPRGAAARAGPARAGPARAPLARPAAARAPPARPAAAVGGAGLAGSRTAPGRAGAGAAGGPGRGAVSAATASRVASMSGRMGLGGGPARGQATAPARRGSPRELHSHPLSRQASHLSADSLEGEEAAGPRRAGAPRAASGRRQGPATIARRPGVPRQAGAGARGGDAALPTGAGDAGGGTIVMGEGAGLWDVRADAEAFFRRMVLSASPDGAA